MDLAEAERRIRLLEQRYFELHRATMAEKAGGTESLAAPTQRAQTGVSLRDVERDKREILAEIGMIEDSLLD